MADMKYFVMKIVVLCINIFYSLLKPVKRNEKKITFISRQSDKAGMDFQLLIDCIEKEYPYFEIKTLIKMLKPGLFNKISYALHIPVQLYHIAASKLVVLDGYCVAVSVLKNKRDVQVIQLWHALGAVKKFGYQTVGFSAGTDLKTAQIMRMHCNYDYVICASKVTAKIYCESFGISHDNIVYLGLPRIDYILAQYGKNSENIIQEYPQIAGKKNIVYAPTFRKGYDLKFRDLIEKIDLERYNLIIKVHPLDLEGADCENSVDGVIFDVKYHSYNWLGVADIVITDYSALGIEASLLEKPLYFYVYDIEEYSNNTGLNINFDKEAISKYVFEDAGLLVQCFEEQYDYAALKEFRDKYTMFQSNDNTAKLTDFIKKLMESSIAR